MKAEMDNGKIPGGVISIVKDGKLLFAKGYGLADVEHGTPVDPEKHLFRIASTTKLFTWTAVMQLVEQGRLDLDTDINTYLRTFKIPATYKQPITLRHLMTHTAGFEEGSVGYGITTDLNGAPSIAQKLAAHVPARVRPPGQMPSYSNYGAALAGLIVEQVSGMPYDDYVEQRIFAPLGMRYATVREPVPAALAPFKVVGYAREGGAFVRKPATYEGGFRPAGSGSVSALDMTHFMIAALQGGSYDGKSILTPAGMLRMQSPAFTLDPRLPALGLGYYGQNVGGERAWAHGGSDPLFNTELYLFPARRLGVFISFSGGQGDVAAENLTKALIARLYPRQRPAPKVVAIGSLEKYAGRYEFTRRSHTKIDKFYNLISQLPVSASGDRLSMGSGEEEVQFAPIGRDLFQEVGGTRQIAFRTNAAGEVTHMFLDFLSFAPLERVPFFDGSGLWYPSLGLILALFLSAILGLFYRARLIAAMPWPQRRLIWLSAAVAILGTFSIMVLGFLLISTDLVGRLSHIPGSWKIALVMPILFIGLTAVFLAMLPKAWAGKYWSLRNRLYHTAMGAAAIMLTLFFLKWNLVGWNFG
nr:serine hydrolase domain-containing protein [Sphingomonas colocasiae]